MDHFLKYVGEETTTAQVNNGERIEVKKNDIFGCSKKNFKSLRRMYARLFKPATNEEYIESKKPVKTNKGKGSK